MYSHSPLVILRDTFVVDGSKEFSSHLLSFVSVTIALTLVSYLELLSFYNSNLAQCSVSFPDVVTPEPCFKLDAVFTKRQTEERVYRGQAETGAGKLIIKALPPFLMPITRKIVVKGPGQVADLEFPFGCHRPITRCIVCESKVIVEFLELCE